jgi:hypothetical protein
MRAAASRLRGLAADIALAGVRPRNLLASSGIEAPFVDMMWAPQFLALHASSGIAAEMVTSAADQLNRLAGQVDDQLDSWRAACRRIDEEQQASG